MTRPAESLSANEWHAQWSLFQDEERFLFEDWIRPATLETFRGKDVLECGCGGGQHTAMVANVARSVTAIDLYTTDIARKRNSALKNVCFINADLTSLDLKRQFDVVFSIGVIHHTPDPDATFESMYRHCRPGGTMIIWTYSAEGNALMRYLIEPIRKGFVRFLARKVVYCLALTITALFYPIVYTVYEVPFLRFLPYFDYFGNFRKLSFRRNILNVFDKLNAPYTKFTTRQKCAEWMSRGRFEPGSIFITPYKGVSYSLVGRKRQDADSLQAIIHERDTD